MKLPKGLKPSKVLLKGGMRPRLHGAMVRSEKVKRPTVDGEREEDGLVLYATNSYAFVRIELAGDDGDTPGPIPREAVQHMERGVFAALGEDEIRVGITHYERVLSGESPAVSADGYPDYAEVIGPEPAEDDQLHLALSPRLLADVAAALGATKHGMVLTLDLSQCRDMERGSAGRWYSGKVRVRPMPSAGVRNAEGALMPMRPLGAL